MSNLQIDAKYGLDPVIEPGDGQTGADWLELQCPYCGERLGTHIDLSAGSHSYIEDCQVCCQPMSVHLDCDDEGGLRRGWAERSD